MLSPATKIRVLESQTVGMFRQMYLQYGGRTVPDILRACELLSPGEKIVVDRAGELVLAGTVRSRPNDYLPPLIRVKRLEDQTENAEIQLPLHYYYFHEDGYGHRYVGGLGARKWAGLANLVLNTGTIDDSDLSDLTLSLGEDQILRRRNNVADLLTRDAMEQLVALQPDHHRAVDGIYIEKF